MIISRCRSGSGCLNLTREVCDSTLVKVNTLVTFLLFVCTITLGCVQVNAIATYTVLGFSVAALLTTCILVCSCRRERGNELVLQMGVPLETTEIVTESSRESVPTMENATESPVETRENISESLVETIPPTESVVDLDNSLPELETGPTITLPETPLLRNLLSNPSPNFYIPTPILPQKQESSFDLYESRKKEFLSTLEPHNDLPPLFLDDSGEESSEEIKKRLSPILSVNCSKEDE